MISSIITRLPIFCQDPSFKRIDILYHMRKKRRQRFFSLVSTVGFLGIFLYLFFFLSPDTKFSIFNFEITIIPLFLIALFFFVSSLIALILSNFRRGLLLGLFVVSYLILRLLNLTHIFFLIVLIALFLTIELFFSQRK